MAGSDSQDKQLPATAKRIQRARGDGQVARSRDLGHALAAITGVSLLAAFAPEAGEALRQWLAASLRFDALTVAEPGQMLRRLSALSGAALTPVLLLGLVMSLVAVAAAVLSGGWNWTLKPIHPNFGRFNPIAGLGRLFSKQQLIDALKASALALVMGTVAGFYLKAHALDFTNLLAVPLEQGLAQLADALRNGLWLLVLVMAVTAAIDLPLQRHLWSSNLKMSHREVKDEHKEQEGNVEVKAKVKQRMREIARRRMLAAVPGADLVVMNPTHYAVALKYDEATMGAPRIVAKGADLLAMKIRDIAREAQVPVLQSAPLARALYAHGEVDREVPLALFSAVAQVLAYVFQLRAALAGRAPQPGTLPEIAVPPELDPHNEPGRARAAAAADDDEGTA